jgi:hypothetical protein
MTEMLARIRQRSQRPSVERDRSLTGQDPVQAPTPEESTTPPAINPILAALSEQIDALPQVAARRNIRLEATLDKALDRFCDNAGITIETFLEAAYLVCEQDADLRKSLLEVAGDRFQQRKEAGKLRRLYSQLQNTDGLTPPSPAAPQSQSQPENSAPPTTSSKTSPKVAPTKEAPNPETDKKSRVRRQPSG